MCQICRGQYTTTTRFLECCAAVTTIPANLPNLRMLECYSCPLLTHIPPTLLNLEILICYKCPRLAVLPPTLTNLYYLRCYKCPLLTAIPLTYSSLEKLCHSKCPLMKVKPGQTTTLITHYRINYLGQWLRSRTGAKYCYHPQKVGGLLSKRDIALVF